MNARRANLVTAVGLIVLLGVVAGTAPRWSRALMRPLPGAPEPEPESGGPSAPEDEPAARVESQINVKLFFQNAEQTGLEIEERPVKASPELSRQVRAVVEELVRGPQREKLRATLSPATKVLEVFVSARGVAYVDLSKEVREAQPGGSEAELISVYSVVNSLTANFPAVKRVQLLVDDKPTPTLAGHVDLSRPLSPDMTFLAASTLTPVTATP